MNYLLSDTQKVRARNRFLVVCAFLVLIITVIWYISPFRNVAKTVFAQTGVPVWQGKENMVEGAKTVALSLLSRSELVSRAKKLAAAEEKIQTLTLELKALKEENSRLQKVSGSGEDSLPVRILSRTTGSPFDTMFISAGKNMNVEKGDLVFADDLVVLGSVDEVFPTSARVALYSRASTASSAFLSAAGTTVLLEGVGAQNFTIALPESIIASKGDTVSLPLARTNIVAEVVEVSVNKDEPIKTVYLRSPVNIFSLEWVILVHI